MIEHLPKVWKVKKLGNISNIQAGGTPSRSKQEYWNGDIPWLKISNIKTKYIEKSTEFITKDGLNNSSAKLFKTNTILYTIFATLGEVSILKFEATTNQAISGIVITDKDIDIHYLYNYLKSIKEKVKNQGRGVAQSNINLSMLKNFDIPIPPLKQQEKIVKVLDISSSLIEKQKELIESYNLFLKSKFIEMFACPIKNPMGWEIDYLNKYCSKITDGTHHSPPMCKSGYKYITAKHIKENSLIFDGKETYISKKEHTKIYSRCNPIKGDVLYIKDGATTGIACLNPYNEEFSLLSSVALLKPSKIITSEYIIFYLNNHSIKNNILLNMSGGAIKRLTIKKIKNIKIPLPPIELQNKFASIVKKIETIKKKENKKLKLLEDLHNSLMQKAFKGEIK